MADVSDDLLKEKNPPPLDEDDIALLKTYVRGHLPFVSFSIPVFVLRFTMLDRSLFCFVLDVDCGGMRVRADSRLQLRCIGLLFARDYVFDVAASYDWKAHSN
jgi:hypothetical protein